MKKSPSATGLGLLTKLKDKIADAVDGATSSKAKTEPAKEAKENNENANSFDQVERRPLLTDVRANRARPPGNKSNKSNCTQINRIYIESLQVRD